MMKQVIFTIAVILSCAVAFAVDCSDILGDPGCADGAVKHIGYTLGYCQGHLQSAWVGYRLTKDKVETKVAERGDLNFFNDPECPHLSFGPDFTKLECDRGHLCPAADMHWNQEAMKETFYYSNASPQKHKFNAGVWLTLERFVRGFACSEGEIIVITGPVLPKEKNTNTEIGKRVTVPEKFYKVVYAPKAEKMIGFLVPHKIDLVNPKPFACTVDEVEKETGLDFFRDLPFDVQDSLESRYDMAGWTWVQRD